MMTKKIMVIIDTENQFIKKYIIKKYKKNC